MPVERSIPVEPEQTEMRKSVTPQRVPLPMLVIGYKTPGRKSDDHYALGLLGTILGEGRSSRLDRALVGNEKPLCAEAGAGELKLEDAGVFMVDARIMQGKDPDAVRKVMLEKNIPIDSQFPKGIEIYTRTSFDLVVNMSGEKLPKKFDPVIRNWLVADPMGSSDGVFRQVRDEIETLVMKLVLEFRSKAKLLKK